MKKLSDILNSVDLGIRKDIVDQNKKKIIDILNKNTSLSLKEDQVFIKKGVVNIKTDSNNKFIILINFESVKNELIKIEGIFNLEL
jgi:hypothetical protein